MFVLATGRLPKFSGREDLDRNCYQWLRVQCGRIVSGYLPDKMTQRLLNAHALIAEYVETFVQRVRANEKMLGAPCEQCVQQGLGTGQG